MTGESGANRTFRSIFGGQEKLFDEVLKLEMDGTASGVVDSSAGASVATINEDKDDDDDDDGDDGDDDDDAMWNEELLPDCDAAAKDTKDQLGLQFAQHRSMEEWADVDDEEDNWKDALQDRVDQLELAFLPDDDDGSVADDRCRLEQQSSYELRVNEVDTWSIERQVVDRAAASTLVHESRMRSCSIDCIARSTQTVEHYRKRSRSLSDTIDMMESPHHSLSRKNLLSSGRDCISRSNGRDVRGMEALLPADATLSISSSAAVSVLSDTEAIRRFVLDDIKSISVERLVSDAQRLYFLEDFYQNQRRQDLVMPVIISTAASSPPSASSSSTMPAP